MPEELKTCPFCGGFVKESHTPDMEWCVILCRKCKLYMKSKRIDELVERWNRRVKE